MKKLMTIPALVVVVMLIFSSCKKDRTCECKEITVAGTDTVEKTNSAYTIKATKHDAELQCKYYETEGLWLKRYAITYHDCALK